MCDFLSLDADLFSLSSRSNTPKVIARAHKAGREILVWSISDPGQLKYFIDLRVDNIITNHPTLVKDIIKRRSQMSYGERLVQKLEHWLR